MSTIRIRRDPRWGDVIVLEGRQLATLVPGGIAWSPHAAPGERLRIEQWLARRRETPAPSDWPIALPETYMRPNLMIASGLVGRAFRAPWTRWANSDERLVIRAPSGAPLPSGYREELSDRPVCDEEREHAVREARRIGYEIDDVDLEVRRRRGDPWYMPHIHDAPLGYDSDRCEAAAAMHLTSEHAIVILRPTLNDIQDARCRWTSGIGIGGYYRAMPGSAPTPAEALESALRAWRAVLSAAARDIHAARGGTLDAWGLRASPRSEPRILRLGREGDAWSELRADLQRDPAPRTGLEGLSGLYADGTPAV